MTFKVPIRSIVVLPGRGRKEFTRIEELAESIKKNGLISPIYVVKNTDPQKPDTWILVAGERRYRASILAGLKELPANDHSEISDLQQKIIELEENVCRQDLTWMEQAELHRQIDELRRKQDGSWNQKKTAELVDLSEGMVSQQIKVARKLKEQPELVKEVSHLPMAAALKVIERKEEVARVDRLQAQGKLQVTTDLKLGSCLDLIKTLPANSVDMLLTDPPYGIEKLEDIREKGQSGAFTGHAMMSEFHNQDIDTVLGLLRKLAPELVRVLKPGAHWYMFCGYEYVGEFVKALQPLVFQPPILIWDREKPTTPGYGYNYLNRIETIIYGFNPPRSRRLAKNVYNIIPHPEVPRSLRTYPTEKPTGLLKVLIEQSTILGDVILDPFAGSGSTLKAARELGRRSIGFEINPESWKRTQLNLSGVTPEVEPTLLPDDDPAERALTAKFSVKGRRSNEQST